MKWFQENFKKIVYTAFLIPIILVAAVSISHVTQWYGISNPMSWALYLSVGIEIAALSALAAIAAKMGRKVYFPFAIVTLIQFLGNVYFAYSFIDLGSKSFKDWVDMVDPIVSFMGVESGDMIGHKRFLALFAGGLLPLISLSFLHMLIKFEEEDRLNQSIQSNNTPTSSDQEQKQILTELVSESQINGLHEHYFDNPPTIIDDSEEEVKIDTIVEPYNISEIAEKQYSGQTLEIENQSIKENETVVENQEVKSDLDSTNIQQEEEIVLDPLTITAEFVQKIEETDDQIIKEISETPSVKHKKVLSYTKRDV